MCTCKALKSCIKTYLNLGVYCFHITNLLFYTVKLFIIRWHPFNGHIYIYQICFQLIIVQSINSIN